MSKELVVASSPHETRLAILENDRLVEVYIERESQQGLAGSIHKGGVTRVLPGMQSAFVDIGLERDAFLYVSDFVDSEAYYDGEVSEAVAEAASEVPVPEESERSRRRERRGRRGRRGRHRGSRKEGFPQTKYASVPKTKKGEPEEEKETDAQVAQVEEAGKTDEPADDTTGFTVLPGESLAKYGEAPLAADQASEERAPDRESADRRPEESGQEGSENGDEQENLAADPEPESRAEEPSPAAFEDSRVEAEERKSRIGIANEETSAEAVESGSDRPPNEDESGETEELFSRGDRRSPSSPNQSNATREAEEKPGAAVSAETEAVSENEELASRAEESESGTEDPTSGGPLGGRGGASDLTPGDSDETRVPGQPLESEEEVRLRGGSSSSRSLQKRGRRGRRRRSRDREPVTEEQSRSGEETIEATAADTNGRHKIANLLSKGKEILVQIAKEPLGRKGARITSYIALPGRYLVYMPTVEHVGVSRKISSDDERRRLRSIVNEHRTGMPGGFIVRTAGEGAAEEEIRGDMLFLYNLWLDIRERAEKRRTPGLVHQDLDIVERVLRDQLDEDFKTIWVDGEDEYERILRFVERFQPRLLPCVKLYTRPLPIFDEFNITPEMEKALRPKVWLKSGGYIVINQTEALVAIDVNTGKYVGKSDRLEDTIVNTNIEAVKEIARQFRLRDLGGIIVVDFIDMEDRKNRQLVLQTIEEELRHDSAPSKVLPFNDFGLVSITRKRTKQSLERALCTSCPYCHGSGSVKSVVTVIHEIFDEARKLAPNMERRKDVTLRANSEVARRLKSRDNTYLQEIEEILHAHVLVRSDVSLHRENFSID